MTAAEYLTERGWIASRDPQVDSWRDPRWVGSPVSSYDQSNGGREAVDAVTIQQARDRAEERAAWVQFAATVGGAASSVNGDWMVGEKEGAMIADRLVDTYRDRYAVEIVPDDVKP